MTQTRRRLLGVAVLVWVASLLVTIVLDPTGGHGPTQSRPPLWGWWVIGSLLTVAVAAIGSALVIFARWAFRRDTPARMTERERSALEVELGIGDHPFTGRRGAPRQVFEPWDEA